MSSAQPSRSSRTTRLLGLSVVAVVAALAPLFGSLVTTNIFVVSEEDPVLEDVYVTSRSAVVDGLIDGDLTAFSGTVTINGEVTGDVTVFSSATVRISEGATVGGALRGAAVNVVVAGSVGSDVFVSAASIVVEESATIVRDVMTFGGVTTIKGTVGRDVRGRTIRTRVDGLVGGDIDVATQRFEVGAGAVIEGDILYRSPIGASIDPTATISGTVTRLPAQSNFVYGVILTLANVIGFLGFLVAGLVALLLLRGSSARATGAMITKPFRSFLYGLAAVLALPAAVLVLAATLVGIPLAIILVCAIVVAFVIGPVPAVTALGNRVLVRRGGLFAAFLVGATLWRLGIWIVPVVGGFLYLIGLVWGIGAWIVGFIDTRTGEEYPVGLLPPSLLATGGVPDDWEPPRAPRTTAEQTPVESDRDEGTGEQGTGTDDAPPDAPSEQADEPSAPPPPEAEVAEARDVEPEDGAGEHTPDEPMEQDDDVTDRRARFDALIAEVDAEARDDAPDGSDGGTSSDDWGLPSP